MLINNLTFIDFEYLRRYNSISLVYFYWLGNISLKFCFFLRDNLSKSFLSWLNRLDLTWDETLLLERNKAIFTCLTFKIVIVNVTIVNSLCWKYTAVSNHIITRWTLSAYSRCLVKKFALLTWIAFSILKCKPRSTFWAWSFNIQAIDSTNTLSCF